MRKQIVAGIALLLTVSICAFGTLTTNYDSTRAAQIQHTANGNELDIGPTGAVYFLSGSVVDMTNATKQATAGIGTAQTPTGLVTQEREPNVHKTILTFTNSVVTMTDQGSNGNQGNLKVYQFPAGYIDVLGVEGNLTIAASGTPGLASTAPVVGSFGTVVAATSDATLTGTEANFVASTACTLTAYAGAFAARTASGTNVQLDGVSAAVACYLNFACAHSGSSGNDTLTVNGTVTIHWMNLGTN